MNESQNIIEVDGLSKSYDGLKAVDGICFSVKRGELFGFLGPNGAGKTTTINMLTGLAIPDAGSIKIGETDCTKKHRTAQELMGVVADESNLYPELSGFDNLCFCGALYGMPRQKRRDRANLLLDMFGLKEAANRKFGGYSKGMKRKLTIAAGIIHEPKILFLDEPTTGLDVASARQLRALISDLHNGGTTIFLTTHYIEEAQRLCERIAFIVGGKIVKTDTLENLLQPLQNKHIVEIVCTELDVVIKNKLSESFADIKFFFHRKGIRIESDNPISAGAIVRLLEEQNIEVSEARRLRANLEDVFIQITGIEADVMNKDKGLAGGKL